MLAYSHRVSEPAGGDKPELDSEAVSELTGEVGPDPGGGVETKLPELGLSLIHI